MRLSINLIALYSFLGKGCGQGDSDLFSLEFSDEVHSNSSKLSQSKVDIRNHFFIVIGWSNTGSSFLER